MGRSANPFRQRLLRACMRVPPHGAVVALLHAWVAVPGETPEVRCTHVAKVVGIYEVPDYEWMVPFEVEQRHYIIQIAMGWTNSHLHDFTIHGKRYTEPHPDDWEPVLDERDYTLRDVAPRARTKIVYQYDFGDSWYHEVVVEKTTLPIEPKTKYPICGAGKHACPPEDVGGTWGYVEFLEALRNPEHDEHESYVEWIGGEFDPEAFDLDAVNKELRRMVKKAVQRGRSERRGESYSAPYVEPLSDARTKLADFSTSC